MTALKELSTETLKVIWLKCVVHNREAMYIMATYSIAHNPSASHTLTDMAVASLAMPKVVDIIVPT